MKNILTIFAITLFITACNSQGEQLEIAEKEVLALHDDVMPKLEDIMSLKSKIATKIQRLDSLQNEGITGNKLAEERMKLTDISQKLSDSDTMMMKWMQQYNADSAKKLKPDAAIQYFNAEREKMLEIQNFTNKSINEAQAKIN